MKKINSMKFLALVLFLIMPSFGAADSRAELARLERDLGKLSEIYEHYGPNAKQPLSHLADAEYVHSYWDGAVSILSHIERLALLVHHICTKWPKECAGLDPEFAAHAIHSYHDYHEKLSLSTEFFEFIIENYGQVLSQRKRRIINKMNKVGDTARIEFFQNHPQLMNENGELTPQGKSLLNIEYIVDKLDTIMARERQDEVGNKKKFEEISQPGELERRIKRWFTAPEYEPLLPLALELARFYYQVTEPARMMPYKKKVETIITEINGTIKNGNFRGTQTVTVCEYFLNPLVTMPFELTWKAAEIWFKFAKIPSSAFLKGRTH